MSDSNQDKRFFASSFKIGANSKGNDRVQFYLGLEDALELASEIASKANEGTGTGVQLDIHKTVGQKDGKTIVGGMMFCKSKQPQQGRQSSNNYAPKNGGKSQQQIIEELQAKLKNSQVG